MTDYPNGVYFGLAFEEYEQIERLSKSRIKRLLISPADFWCDSWLNPKPIKLTPEQERRRKIALLLGKAYHCARLEPEAFDGRYVREISQSDFADADGFLGTGSAIEAELAERGEPKKSKDDDGVLGQARRLAALGYDGPIWHIMQAEWEAERHGRIAIPGEAYDQIVIDMERLAAVSDVHAALSSGAGEVSILYDCPDTGLPMKARLDWLRGDGWVEFKSFANPNGKHLEQCLLDAIRFNGYYIDVACYHEAIEAIRSCSIGIEGGIGKWTDEQEALVNAIRSSPRPLPHRIVFQQKGGVPNVLSRTLRLYESPFAAVEELQRDGATEDRIAKATRFAEQATAQPTMLMMKAKAEIKRAKRTFIGYSEIYARGDPWLPFDPHREISDMDFNPHWLETI